MPKKDYYKILGINKSASEKQIKEAYKKLALKWHPDRWANKTETEKKKAEKEMVEINQAYKVLSDSKKRENYDKYGDEEGSFNFSGGPFQGFETSSDFFDEILGSFGFGSKSNFNQGQQKNYENSPKRGKDINLDLEINFREHIFGAKKNISLEIEKSCNYCKQSGANSPADIINCPNCQGNGMVHTNQSTIFGTFRTQIVCPSCRGEKQIIKKKCVYCFGRKFTKNFEKIEIEFPRGLQPEQAIRYKGLGNEGLKGGPKGDLIVNLKIKNNDYFERKGNDVHVKLPISFLDAILGNKVKVITLEGIEEIKVSQGTQNNEFLLLENKGCYESPERNNRGNFIIWFKVKIPKKIGERSEKIIRDIYEKTSWNPNKEFVEKNSKIFE